MRQILIVDDEEDVLISLKSSLERKKDFRVATARDGGGGLGDPQDAAPGSGGP